MKIASESLRVEAGLQACFSSESTTFTIEISGEAATISIGQARGGGLGCESGAVTSRPIAMEAARRILSEVQAIVSRHPKLLGDRSTTVYKTTASWTRGNSKIEWNMSSSEMPLEMALEVIESFSSEKQALFRQAYEGYFNPAHELFRFARSVVLEYTP